ncbi:hypothetical protein dqs_1067 [Azoarcus olearius]|uniref:hypothetical protein n=1 Tax=Azoarcus sp. (strain BH72) TaxID=418699 RepID=UPI00080608F6|nr:hypothetical protein [Azoarcus olearius]ANQ84131.1 hypothetical protein dqs_1067 [Azoarcus olearius]
MTSNESLTKLGYRLGRGGTHAARTMMFDELTVLFEHTTPDTTRDGYREEVVSLNILGKPTQKSRALTFGHLTELYGLDPAIPVFRVFRRLWALDEGARPLLALMLALVRDPVLRLSESFVLAKAEGESVLREDVEEFIAAKEPDRFSAASLKSIAQNINGSWTQAGFMTGRVRKVRTAPKVTPTNITYALFLGHLEGLTGQRLFSSRWMTLLCSSPSELETLANSASHRGQIVFLNAGGVKEVRFPGFLTAEEEQWLHE